MKTNDLIKQRREELGLTLEQVGDYVGVGKSTVRKWESGFIKNMRRDKISRLAEILGISPLDLMQEENNATTVVEDLELASWMGSLLNNESEEMYRLLKIISNLSDDEVKTLLVMAEALDNKKSL